MESAETPRDTVELIRKRPGMYVGSVTRRGAMHLFHELLDNAIDRFLAGHAKNISIESDTQSVEVRDDGDGMPFDVSDSQCGNRMTRFLTQCHFTNTADDHAPHIHGGLHGVGIAVVNALTIEMAVTTWRGGGRWTQSFSRGKPTTDALFHPNEPGRGSIVCIRLDPEIFVGVELSCSGIRQRVFTAVHLFPGLRIACNGEVFYAPNGLADLGAIMGGGLDLVSDRPLSVRKMVGAVSVEAAVFQSGWRNLDHPIVISFANGVQTVEEGSHVAGMLQAFNSVGWHPALAILHVVMYDAKYAGPTKTRLESPAARSAVRTAMEAPIVAYCQHHALGRFAKRPS